MLDLKDFNHLPLLDEYFEQIAEDAPGVTVVAGLEPPPQGIAAALKLPPSGRSMVFGILVRRVLSAYPRARTIVVAESKDGLRVSRRQGWQVEYLIPKPPETIGQLIERAIERKAQILIVEHLNAENAGLVFAAVERGIRVLTQLDSALRGADAARQLLDFRVTPAQLQALRWIVAVRRLPQLCKQCKEREASDSKNAARLRALYPDLADGDMFFRAGQCEDCDGGGYKGDVAAFDIFRTDNAADIFHQSSAVPLEEYALALAKEGLVAAEDVLRIDADTLYRMSQLWTASRDALVQTTATHQTQLAQLELTSRVLQQQTEASISLQQVSHALITLNTPEELGDYICQKARVLCGADRAILYWMHPDHTAEILALSGWDASLLHKQMDAELLFSANAKDASAASEPTAFKGYPPGTTTREPDVEGVYLRAGLRVPLIAQNEVVGLLIFHSTVKPKFAPREVALLQTFANQSALAFQRAGLIEALREQIERLEAAQIEIAKKERLEGELETARQVQQSMLPKIFPLVPGLEFCARSEPARQVGGDFYDVFVLDGDRVGVVIADVSDKGMPAALFMALTDSLLYAEARREASPEVVLTRVHQLLLELSTPSLFVTIFYGVIDTTARRMTYVRAGHERPLLVREHVASQLPGDGTVVGLLDSALVHFPEQRVDLQAGDRLVLYTDGLIDAPGAKGDSFGRQRLIQLVESQANAPLAQMCDTAFEQVKKHEGELEPFDDMTMLAMQVNWQ